jgi:hypothetical protein
MREASLGSGVRSLSAGTHAARSPLRKHVCTRSASRVSRRRADECGRRRKRRTAQGHADMRWQQARHARAAADVRMVGPRNHRLRVPIGCLRGKMANSRREGYDANSRRYRFALRQNRSGRDYFFTRLGSGKPQVLLRRGVRPPGKYFTTARATAPSRSFPGLPPSLRREPPAGHLRNLDGGNVCCAALRCAGAAAILADVGWP